MGAARRQDVGSRAQVLDQRELQRRRPRPQLAHRQRRDRLKCRDEPVQPLRIEPAGAAANQLERHRVNARQAGELVGGDPRQPPEERRRQIVVNVAQRGENDVEVVEQPLRRRRRGFAAFGVVGQRRVDLAKARDVREVLDMRAAAAPPAGETVNSAASRLACSSSGSMPSSSMPPGGRAGRGRHA